MTDKQTEYIEKMGKVYNILTSICGDGEHSVFSADIHERLLYMFNESDDIVADMHIETDEIFQKEYNNV